MDYIRIAEQVTVTDINGAQIAPGQRIAYARRDGNMGVLAFARVVEVTGLSFNARLVVDPEPTRVGQRKPPRVVVWDPEHRVLCVPERAVGETPRA